MLPVRVMRPLTSGRWVCLPKPPCAGRSDRPARIEVVIRLNALAGGDLRDAIENEPDLVVIKQDAEIQSHETGLHDLVAGQDGLPDRLGLLFRRSFDGGGKAWRRRNRRAPGCRSGRSASGNQLLVDEQAGPLPFFTRNEKIGSRPGLAGRGFPAARDLARR